MNLFALHHGKSKYFYLLLTLLTVTSGLTNFGILILINKAVTGLKDGVLGEWDYLLFTALISLSFISMLTFQRFLVKLTNDLMFGLQLSLMRKIKDASYEAFLQLTNERIYSAMNDTHVLSRVPEMFVVMVGAFITILCAVCYLFVISPAGMLVVLVVMVLLLARYLYTNKKIEVNVQQVRFLQDKYYGLLGDMISGIKQMKISSDRNERFYSNYVESNRAKSKSLSNDTSQKYIFNQLIASYSWYIVLGVIIFFLPRFFTFDRVQMASFLTTVLFLIPSVSNLVGIIPFYTTVKVTVKRFGEIDKILSIKDHQFVECRNVVPDFHTICFENVKYRYEGVDTDFELELKKLQISKGEILFISGGNGSGKTTFINVLTGLFRPISGRVFIDGQEISWTQFSDFRNKMAAVFADHHLFNENYDGNDFKAKEKMIADLQSTLKLDGVLEIDYDKNLIGNNLSKGQQRRVALLMALLEDKPIIILDEWAAEQDPTCRKLFYNEWLQIMKASGKTVIAISHDDYFYDMADRVLKFQYGRLVEYEEDVRA